MARKQVLFVEAGCYYCSECHAAGKDSLKDNARPHCMKCGKHHPLHLDCHGKMLVIDIPHAQLFYSFPSASQAILEG